VSEVPTVVLTGASAGIGLAALEQLADRAFVLAVSRTRPPLDGLQGVWLPADLCTPEAAAAQILEQLELADRPLDGMIHCAASYGVGGRHSLQETLDEEWDELMMVNVRSQFILTKRLLPHLLKRSQAFVVAMTSDAATQPAPGRIAYACSKAASRALFSGLAEELSQSPVSLIQILPQRQVLTRGLRNRRPTGFDFSGYLSTDAFKGLFANILACRGKGMNGACLHVS
jgi:cyclitol oxidoreductase